ncbi:unnamed protein product [Discula destructiva]
MTSYDFTAGSQWTPMYYSMGSQSHQSLLPHVSQGPPPPPVQSPWDHSSPYRLTVKQQPERAKAANEKDKDRKPVDPPPILQLDVDPNQDPLQVYITSPYLFVQTFLIGASDSDPEPDLNSLTGNTCTSGHVVKDDRGVHNMMFCLSDISVKKEGSYRLKFCLFKLNTTTGDVENLTSICSQPFTTSSGRHFPGMSESTSMTRLLVDAGVRLRLRKESRAMSTKKKNNAYAQMMSRQGLGGDGDDERPVKRMRSEPLDKDSLASSKQSSFSGAAHSYTSHSTPSITMSHFPGTFHAATSSPSQNIMAPIHSMSGAYDSGTQLGLDSHVSHYHSPHSTGSSYPSPGRQSPPSAYPVHGVSPASSHGLLPSSNSLAHFSNSHSAHTPMLPPVEMGGSHGSSSPDMNYTTSAQYHGEYMPSQSGGPRTSMPHRSGSSIGSAHMPMRMELQNGHAGYGESGIFDYGH